MNNGVPPELVAFIREGSAFLVAGHKEPDGDCVGSQLALCSVLERLGKRVLACSAGPFKRTEIKPYEHRFTARPGPEEREGARVIMVDCSAPERAGDLSPFLEKLPVAVIDHHKTGDHGPSGAESPVYLDPGAPSTTFMVQRLVEALGLELTEEEAGLLFFGLCTDTGFFRHVDSDGAETFAAASRLIRAGASPKRAFLAINGGKNLDSRRLLGLILSRAESHFGGRLILSCEELEETARFGLEGRDSDSLYQLLQSVEGVEAIVIIRQEEPGTCTIGLRSRDAVDVAAVAAALGGGGHKNAAGASSPGTIAPLRLAILEIFSRIFSG
ncbi:MAG: bifunctional oligoribonuclease/PAP phosphatase NrnA [Treponema sp.]|jgi:phosphoesterase RecJ-like protein|nr:bifunctional oligoribonuclease/PAP phosphatase NrnA [Treponema sp.]